MQFRLEKYFVRNESVVLIFPDYVRLKHSLFKITCINKFYKASGTSLYKNNFKKPFNTVYNIEVIRDAMVNIVENLVRYVIYTSVIYLKHRYPLMGASIHKNSTGQI